jgi:2-hydroxyacyl-CoA lyase 1
LVLSGSSETHNSNKGAFQEVDAISLLTPLAKLAIRPPYPDMIPSSIRDAYRAAMFGRPGPTFVDLPANLILGTFEVDRQKLSPILEAPQSTAPQNKIREVAEVIKSARAPLVVIGKGAAYARAEEQIKTLVDR